MVGHAGPGFRIIDLLRLPGNKAVFYVDLPAAGPGAVHAMGGTHHAVLLPTRAVAVLPIPILVGQHAVLAGKRFDPLPEEQQSILQVAHRYPPTESSDCSRLKPNTTAMENTASTT